MTQDLIILNNGNEIKSIVQEIGVEYVKYKKFENQTGPLYNVPIADIFMIKYQNGSKDVFNEVPTPPESKPEQPKIINQEEVDKPVEKKENPVPESESFVLRKNSKIMINTFVLMASQANTLCKTLVDEFRKKGFCCVSKMIEKDDPTADVVIYVHATPASITFNFYDKALDKEVYAKTYLFQLSIKDVAKKLVKEVTPFIEK
jgi:hypothetical protein